MNAQLRLIDDYNAGRVRAVSPSARCGKCPRPHLPYRPLCGPCEEIAGKAYWAAPKAED